MLDEEQREGGAILRPGPAARVASIYLLLASAWILLSDVFVARLTDDPGDLTRLQTIKGWFFVGIMTAVIYVLVRRALEARRRADERADRDETRLRALLENLEETVTVLDKDGRVVYTSDSVEAVTGYRPDQRAGRSVMDRVVPEDGDRARSLLAEVAAEPGARRNGSLRIVHRDGSVRHLEVTARNLLHDAAVSGIILNARDRTRERQLEAEMRQAQKMEAVGRLTGGIAHDFNNVLTVILSCTESLAEGVSGEDDWPEIEHLRHAAEQSRAVVRQLLTFSRRRPAEEETVDVGARLREVAGLVRATLPSRITVKVEVSDEPLAARFGAGQLEQVVMNLAVNARDAIEGRGTIVFAADSVELPTNGGPLPPGRHVRIAVSDTGRGVPESIRDQVFDPFFTTKPQGVGTGLGLSMVFGAVQQAGGTVTLRSEEGKGTTFDILLPVAAVAAGGPTAEGGTRLGLPPDGAPKPRGGSETILIVDDEPSIRALATRALRRYGYQVLEAADGQQALHVMSGHHIDLVVTDTHMPRMDGLELLHAIAERTPRQRAILISGDTVEHVDAPDGIPFIEKPYTTRALAAAIRSVLDSDALVTG